MSLERWPLRYSTVGQLRLLVKHRGIDHVIDVGAHQGRFGLQLREDLGYLGDISSYEPAPHLYEGLVHVAAADPAWHTYQLALSDWSGKSVFNFEETRGFMSSLLVPDSSLDEISPRDLIFRQIDVDVRRLDSLPEMRELAASSVLLKIDTQGNDLAVLRGAAAIIPKISYLLLEADVAGQYVNVPMLSDYFLMTESIGFELLGVFPVNYWANGTRVTDFDLLFQRRVD